MIDLYQFTPAFGHANLSPFCMKVEAFLRLSEIPFQIIEENDPRKGPKSKLPFIRDNGLVIGDSELIFDYLESKYDFHMDGHLDPHTQAVQHSVIRMLDEHLYWALIYSRWGDETNWGAFKEQLFGTIPPPISSIIAAKVRKDMRKQMHAQGAGRHNGDEIYAMAQKDIKHLSFLLGGNTWFGGNYVSKLDITATAYLSNLLIPELSNPLSEYLQKYDNLLEYSQRAYSVLFPEPIKQRHIPGKINIEAD